MCLDGVYSKSKFSCDCCLAVGKLMFTVSFWSSTLQHFLGHLSLRGRTSVVWSKGWKTRQTGARWPRPPAGPPRSNPTWANAPVSTPPQYTTTIKQHYQPPFLSTWQGRSDLFLSYSPKDDQRSCRVHLCVIKTAVINRAQSFPWPRYLVRETLCPSYRLKL